LAAFKLEEIFMPDELTQFLNNPKYRAMSVEELAATINGTEVSWDVYANLPGALSKQKATLLYRKWHKKPLKAAVAAKTSLNKRSSAPKTPPKSAKRRLRTA
jgi:hypothetical protein